MFLCGSALLVSLGGFSSLVLRAAPLPTTATSLGALSESHRTAWSVWDGGTASSRLFTSEVVY